MLELVAVHQHALTNAIAQASEPLRTTNAAGELLREALSAYEMVYRAVEEARRAADAERRQLALVRRFSSFLAEASPSADATEANEVLALLVEYARELTNATCGVATYGASAEAVVSHTGDEHCFSLLGPLIRVSPSILAAITPPAARSKRSAAVNGARGIELSDAQGHPLPWLGVPLESAHGRSGVLQLVGTTERDFSEADEATVVHLVQMAMATIDRLRA